MAKNPWLAAALSFLIAGAGQVYAGAVKKGVVFLILEVATGWVYFAVHEEAGAVLNLFVGLASIVDAYNEAKKTKNHEKREPEQQRPEVKVF